MIQADLLLAHAASHTIKLAEDIVSTVVQSKQLLDANLSNKASIGQKIVFGKCLPNCLGKPRVD